MHPNQELLETFYKAFRDSDSAVMAACYHEEATFDDPVFKNLNSEEVKAMWTMLIERGKGETQIIYSNIEANNAQGKAYWEAKYKFSQSGNMVHNKINASFTFKEGKILSHQDDFDLKKWAGMALGIVGKIFGGTTWLQNKIRKQARTSLTNHINRN